MSFNPSNRGRFRVSRTKAGVVTRNNKVVFQGFGYDYSANDNVIYIANVDLERVVPIKAFINSVKLNLQKEIETVNLKDRDHGFDKEYSTKVDYDIALNMPAHSVNEAANNLAKMEELQRLIMDGGTDAYGNGISSRYALKKTVFVVWFKNIINSGHKIIKTLKTPTNFEQIMNSGFCCYIEEVIYEPDVGAGFFEHNGDLFPKNIILNLKLNYESHTLSQLQNKPQGLTIAPFLENGQYTMGDSSLFPFGITVRGTNGFPERPDEITKKSQQMTQSQMNNIFTNRYNALTSYLFISLPINENSGTSVGDDEDFYDDIENKRTRFVVFKPFIESFARRNKVTVDTAAEADNPIYSSVKIGGTSFDSHDYSIKINLPAASLTEAKQNCAKIQYLIRMFVRRGHAKKSNGGAKLSVDEALAKSVENTEKKSKVRVYMPKKIEKPNSSGVPQSFSTMYNNSLPFLFETLDIEIQAENGFFEEGGMIFPKAMSLSMKFTDNSGLIAPIKLISSDVNDGYTLNTDKQIIKTELTEALADLYPFDRKTVKFTLGGS